jgi:hypothetical protein
MFVHISSLKASPNQKADLIIYLKIYFNEKTY